MAFLKKLFGGKDSHPSSTHSYYSDDSKSTKPKSSSKGSSYGSSYSSSGTVCSDAETKKKPESEQFKVVQMVADPACPPPTGIIGYVYTYTIRKRRHVVKKGVPPKQPYQVVMVKEPADEIKKRDDPETKIKEADDDIDFANRQIARYCIDKERAQQRRRDAEEMRYREEERDKEKEAKENDKDKQGNKPSKEKVRNEGINKGNCGACCDPCAEWRKRRGLSPRKCYPCPIPAITIKYTPRTPTKNQRRDRSDNSCSESTMR